MLEPYLLQANQRLQFESVSMLGLVYPVGICKVFFFLFPFA